MSENRPPAVLRYREIEWDRPLQTATGATAPPAELVKEAKRSGARRKKVVRGEAGFFMNRSVLPAGFAIPAHSHDHAELLVVLAGSMRFEDGSAELRADDAVAIEANTRYGFVAGDDGVEFLTIRAGEASVDVTRG